MAAWSEKKLAVWAMTPGGAELALRVKDRWGNADLFFPAELKAAGESRRFTGFAQTLEQVFSRYDGHYFIMAAGIVVRVAAKLLDAKTTDPAITVGDEAGRFIISLVSGHIGGANALARELAALLGAEPVITTSTDVNQAPAMDVIAGHLGLYIENPRAVKDVSMAYIKGRALPFHDPQGLVRPHLPREYILEPPVFSSSGPGVFVDYELRDLPERVLRLRPGCLVAGIGCRRGVSKTELEAFVLGVFKSHGLSIHSLAKIVTVDLKADETGLTELAAALGVPLHFYSTGELDQVEKVPHPSALVDKHIGVKSVCEAAAILATGQRPLIVPKQSSKTATIAIAKMSFTS